MQATEYDLVVLGGGNAFGLVLEAAGAGQTVALIEEGPLGGTCPNRGCIPSKLLLGYAEVANHVRGADRFHIQADLNAIDGEALLKETFTATRKTDGKLAAALPDNVTLIRGRGRFVGDREIEVGDTRVRGTRVVIAVGGRPRRLDIPGLAGTPYWTSDDLFKMERLPKSIAIIGGGCIGLEMGNFLSGVGVDTTVIHRSAELMDPADEELRPLLTAGFTSSVKTLLNSGVTGVQYADGQFTLEITHEDGTTLTRQVEHLLLAVGRVPNSEDVGFDKAGIELDGRGFLITDDHLQTTAAGVYGLGDINGAYGLTHAATFEATYLARLFTQGDTGPIDHGAMPAACFTRPEYASAGPSEQVLRDSGVAYLKATASYTSAAKGRALKEAHGACKFLIDPEGKILACHIVGEHASILIHEVVPVMRWRNHISSLTEIIHVHPSLSEVVRNAARKAHALLDVATHVRG